jgi:hypothetical protein
MFTKKVRQFIEDTFTKTVKETNEFNVEFKEKTKKINDFRKEMDNWSNGRKITRNR